MSLYSVERWSDWECNGGKKRAAVRVISGSFGEQLDGSDSADLVVRHDTRSPFALREVVRITEVVTGNVWEYRVQSLGRTLANQTRQVRALSPIADFGQAGRVRSNGGKPTYDLGGLMTLSEFLSDIVLTNLADDGLAWAAAGTIESTSVRFLRSDLDGEMGWPHLRWLRELASTFERELRFRRNGSTNYLIDYLTQRGSTAPRVRLLQGKNLLDVQETQDDGELATAIQVLGRFDACAIAENAWVLGTPSGAGPYWIPLSDYDTTAPKPIVFDDQVNGYYLLTRTGTTVAITDSRASDSAVQVASLTGLTEGDLVQIVRNSDGHRLFELSNPNAKRLFRVDDGFVDFTSRNLARNGNFASFTGLVPDYWGGMASTDAFKYPRSSPTTYTLTGGNGGVSSTTVTITAGPANLIIYKGEWVRWGGTDRLIGATTQLNGSGTGTITMFTAVAVADGTTITEGAGIRNLRNLEFPDATFYAGGNVLWLTGTNRTVFQGSTSGIGTYSSSSGDCVTTEEFTVKYVPGVTDYLYANSAWSLRTAIDLYNRDSSNVETSLAASVAYRNLPSMVVGSGANTFRIAGLWTQRVDANSTAHADISVEYPLTGNLTFRVQCFGTVSKTTSSTDPDPSCFLRQVMVGIRAEGATTPTLCGDSANACLSWHRTNRGLLARQLTVANARVTIADLSKLAGYSITREALALGGTVELVDLGLTARIVGIVFDLRDPANTQVVIDSRPTRLIKFLAERV